jgi:hypothetical protein
MKRIAFYLLIFGLLSVASDLLACTSAVFSGKATADGRPLLWKHRDTDDENNRMAFYKGLRYDFLALLNSADTAGTAWSGCNHAGFAIINTASYNLKNDTVSEMDKEGVLMYRALSECRTLADFEQLLDRYPRPMRVEANFGVIDAEGGAAYYEVNNTHWTKIDANDPAVAPDGYLVYTNFSYTGRPDEGMGYIRHQTAAEILSQAKPEDLSPQWIFNHLSRSYRLSLLGIDLLEEAFSPEKASGWVYSQDFIPRRSSTASLVIQGVKPDENPEMTTLWTILGYPPLGLAIPLWVKSGNNQPALVLRTGHANHAPVCDRVLALKRQVFPIRRGNGAKYMQFNRIYNRRHGDGYMQQLAPAEQAIFDLSAPILARWRQKGLNEKELAALNKQLETIVSQAYASLSVPLD